MYQLGNAVDPPIGGTVAIAHVLSDSGAYGKGFAGAVAHRYPRALRAWKDWSEGGHQFTVRPFELGAIQWVGVGRDWRRDASWQDRWVVNMVAMSGLASAVNPHPLDLDSLRVCLAKLALTAKNLSVAMPRIGTGLARGVWEDIEPLIAGTLDAAGVPTYVLDKP